MIAAVEGGEIELSSLVEFAKAAGSDEKPKFSQTTPVPIEMLEEIRANPDIPARTIVYTGVVDGRWTYEDAESYEENAEVIAMRSKKHKPTKGVYLTRSRKTRTHKADVEGMFVPKTSLDVFCRPGLSDGARACLSLLLALAGKENSLVTYTSSLATMMGRTTRTVRNYFIALEDVGLITRKPGKHYNTVSITIHPDCRPEPYKEPTDITAYKLARKSKNPELNEMAMTVAILSFDAHREHFDNLDRRKVISPFNSESNEYAENNNERQSFTDKPQPNEVKKGSLSPPTTHSNLLIPNDQPINGNKKRFFANSYFEHGYKNTLRA